MTIAAVIRRKGGGVVFWRERGEVNPTPHAFGTIYFQLRAEV